MEDKHLELQTLIKKLDISLDKLEQTILIHKEKITANVYKVDQIDPVTHSSTLTEFSGHNGIIEACNAYKHYIIELGEDTKSVYRYPGIIAVNDKKLFQTLIKIVEEINASKQIITEFIESNNYPITLKTINGEIYKKNGLLYQAIPMANHAMLTRKIMVELEPIQSISFSWNHDVITKQFEDREAYINRIERLYNKPPIHIDIKNWQQQLTTLVNEIHEISDAEDGRFLKWVRRKSPEPQVKYRVEEQIGRLKPHKIKLPIITFSNNPNNKIKKRLSKPPTMRGAMTVGRGITYKKLHANFDFYECTPVKP